MNTEFCDRIADRHKERRNISITVQYQTNGTSYGAVTTTPAGVCTS